MHCARPKCRRLEMILKDTIPAQSEIRRCMGSSMADVFFYHCHPDSRQLLGVIPPLEGPHEELWISPSDQLIQKVALVPPLTNKYIKACTHQGILAIGQKAMEKYERDLNDKILKMHEEQSGDIRNMFEAEKRSAIHLAEQNIRLKYENCIGILQEQFEQKLQTKLAGVLKKCNKTMQKAVIMEKEEVIRRMLQKFRKETTYIINHIYDWFEDTLRAQKETMISEFNEIIRRKRAEEDNRIKEMERKKDEAMKLQRHELEIQNFADITYVLCMERCRSSFEKHALHLRFEKQIEALKKLLTEANDVLDSMKTETLVREIDDKSWETKLPNVVREFQKFINFAFRAVPGQAEFLLSLESLLIPADIDSKLRDPKVREKEKFQSLPNPSLDIVEIIDSSKT